MDPKSTKQIESTPEEKSSAATLEYRTPELRRIGSLDDVRGHGHHGSDHHGGHHE